MILPLRDPLVMHCPIYIWARTKYNPVRMGLLKMEPTDLLMKSTGDHLHPRPPKRFRPHNWGISK
jgi:hypothetical protein